MTYSSRVKAIICAPPPKSNAQPVQTAQMTSASSTGNATCSKPRMENKSVVSARTRVCTKYRASSQICRSRCDRDRQCNKTGPVGVKEPSTLWDVLSCEEWEHALHDGKGKGFSAEAEVPTKRSRQTRTVLRRLQGNPFTLTASMPFALVDMLRVMLVLDVLALRQSWVKDELWELDDRSKLCVRGNCLP